MSLVKKKIFIDIVTEVHKEYMKDYHDSKSHRKLIGACADGVTEVKNFLVNKSNRWLLPVVPSVRFIRLVSNDLWYHVYSNRDKHKFHNTIMHHKDEFLREVTFRLRGTRDL